jgi:hypothetical protein
LSLRGKQWERRGTTKAMAGIGLATIRQIHGAAGSTRRTGNRCQIHPILRTADMSKRPATLLECPKCKTKFQRLPYVREHCGVKLVAVRAVLKVRGKK